jgi:hypothetical protein
MGAALTAATVMREAATGAAALGTVTYVNSITLQFSSYTFYTYRNLELAIIKIEPDLLLILRIMRCIE